MKPEITISDAPPPAVRLCGYGGGCMGIAVGFVKVADGARIDVCHLCYGRAKQRGQDVELDPMEAARKAAN
jgi:hypothetical protein